MGCVPPNKPVQQGSGGTVANGGKGMKPPINFDISGLA